MPFTTQCRSRPCSTYHHVLEKTKKMSIHKGEFNSKLKKTGFLSQPKMEARLIALHPERFLKSYADRKIGILSSENEALEEFIDKVKAAGDYDRKEEILKRKQKEYKNRTFLLNLASTSAVTSDILNPLENPAKDKLDYEELIQNYLTEIKMVDKEDIENWIGTYIDSSAMKLPYGLPQNLRMPLDPNEVEDTAIQGFIDAANDEFLILDGEYHTKMEEISKQLRSNHQNITEKSGWTIAESALLFSIITALEGSAISTASSLQSELTRRIFPNKSTEQIIRQKYLLKTKKFLEEKRANIIRDWLRDKEELQAKTNAAWEALHRERTEQLEKSFRIRKQKEVCLQWASLLTKMIRAKSEQIKRIQTMAEPIASKIQEMEKVRSQKEAERRQSVRSAAQKYREKRMEERLQSLKKKEEEDDLMERERRLELKSRKQRVEFRQSEFEQKIEVRRAKAEAEQKEREKKLAILEKIKEKPEIDYDPTNVLADTHATLVRRHDTYLANTRRGTEEEDMVKFFREQYSFSAESIWADRRVKVEAKLREAGLMDSSYARQVLLAMQPAEKPHLATQIKFDQP